MARRLVTEKPNGSRIVTQKTKIFRQNLALFFGSLLFAAILAEIVLRIVLPDPIVWKYPQETYLYDPEIGHWLEPNQQTFTHDKAVRTNSVGIRDSEYPFRAQDNVYRILAIGDSQTFGNGLDLADTWPKQLETILSSAYGHVRFEVLNIGLPASDTWQHEVIFHRMLEHYHPHSVILAMYVNDIVKRHIPSPPRKKSGGELATRIIYAMKQSSLLLTLRKALRLVRQARPSSRQLTRQDRLIRGEQGQDIDDSWHQVEDSLAAMKKTSVEKDFKLLLVSLPRRDQISGHVPADAYNRKIQVIAERQQIRFLNTLAALQLAYSNLGQALFIPWDGHNSRAANHVIAQQIAGQISLPCNLTDSK